MSDHAESLRQGMQALALPFSEAMLEQQMQHLLLLEQWNRVYNLTAIRSVKEMLYKHVLDSLSVASFWKSGSLADIGTGAGFPGVPLAILYPDRLVALVEVNQKRVIFLRQVVRALSLDNIEIIQSDVRDYHPSILFQNVISRAFSDLQTFIDSAAHLLSTEGSLLAMKGQYPEAELATLPESWQAETSELTVPGLAEARHLVRLHNPHRNLRGVNVN